jgi:hypothetical protein
MPNMTDGTKQQANGVPTIQSLSRLQERMGMQSSIRQHGAQTLTRSSDGETESRERIVVLLGE